MARDLQLLYTVCSELANSERWPNWSTDSEFRAARHASADERECSCPSPCVGRGRLGGGGHGSGGFPRHTPQTPQPLEHTSSAFATSQEPSVGHAGASQYTTW